MGSSASKLKMKIFLSILLISGINYVSCFSSTLSRDLNEIAALIPTQDLFNIFDPVKFNPISHEASDYVSSNDFHNSMFLIFKHPSLKPLKLYLDVNGIDLNELVLKVVLARENMKQSPKETAERRTLKLKSFIELAYSVSQLDNIVSLVIHKTATSTSFRALYNFINGLKYNKIYTDTINAPKVKDMVNALNDVGINTKEVWRALSYLFGWEKTTTIITLEEYEIEEDNQDPTESALFKILRQYINLIPKEKFIFLYRGLLINPLFQEITMYIFNKKYHDIIEKFDKNPMIGEFFDYLQDKGVSFTKFLDLIRDRLGFTYAYYKLPTGTHEENSHSFSLIQFFDLAKQILPINEIKKLTAHLMETSPEYKELTEKIINLVYNQNLELYFENQMETRTTAMQYGFCITKMLNFILQIIGFEYKVPPKGKEFTDSIYEFVDLFPKHDYIALYDEYKNDYNVWKLITYLKSSKFADFVDALFSTNEVKIFTNFLTKQYIPFKAILIDVFDRLGIMKWWINYEYFCGHGTDKCVAPLDPNSDNLCNFVKERINLFPLKEMLILFHSKLQNNDYFQNMYLVLSSIDGANLLKKITEHEVLRDFFVNLVEIGYNFRVIVHQFSQLFGWGNLLSVDLSLNQTFENFDNLIYRKELFKILGKYPDEVQQIREFYKNPAFTNSIYILANTPVVRNIINWMQYLNVPVVNFVNYYFGQDSPNEYHLKLDSQLQWQKMAKDIINFLKKNKIFDFTVEQKYSSIEFHAFLKKLLSVDMKALSVFYDHPEGHYVLDKFYATKINFIDIYDFLKDVEIDNKS